MSSGISISPLFHKPTTCGFSQPESKTALVVEGGGQRGIFTAGILDAWLKANFNPFEVLIGTSAGAQNLSSYITCQAGLGYKAITEFSSHPKFFQLKRSLIGKNAVDLDWYFSQVNNSSMKLDIEQGVSHLGRRKLYFSATRSSDRKAKFFTPNRNNWLDLLKASSALPILYKGGVKVGNHSYMDGGLSAPLPVEEAYNQGARKITVLRTVTEDARVKSPWIHTLKSMICVTGYCPKIIDLITHHEKSYQRNTEFINNPPNDVKINEVYPKQPLSSSLVGSSQQALQLDYQLGTKAGVDYLSSLSVTS